MPKVLGRKLCVPIIFLSRSVSSSWKLVPRTALYADFFAPNHGQRQVGRSADGDEFLWVFKTGKQQIQTKLWYQGLQVPLKKTRS